MDSKKTTLFNCLLGVVPQPTDSRLSETIYREDLLDFLCYLLPCTTKGQRPELTDWLDQPFPDSFPTRKFMTCIMVVIGHDGRTV